MWRMWRILSLLFFCSAGRGLEGLAADTRLETSREKLFLTGPTEMGKPDKGASSPGRAEDREQGDAPAVSLQPTNEPLENELDNQENIISQLLGDYDKVKTESSGSDCVCRCVVRPIKRSDCSRIHDSDPASLSQDFYTVETITEGTDCKKCVCMAPPSAVNPCEGEYRFKKLQEASKDDIKLATIIDLLEGSLYGMDLLKLNSVTTKLLARVGNLEKVFARNFTERTREKERLKEKNKDKDKKVQPKKKKISHLEQSEAAASGQKQKNYESQIKKKQQQDGQLQQQPTKNETETKTTVKDKNNVFIRGVTFYKADEDSYKDEEDKDYKKGREKNAFLIPMAAEDSLVIDEPPTATKNPGPVKPNHEPKSKTLSSSSPTHQPKASSMSSKQTTTTSSTPVTIKMTDQINPTTPRQMTTRFQIYNGDFFSTTPVTPYTTDTNIRPPSNANPTTTLHPRPKSRLSWTESPADQHKTTKKPGVCKDTVASISEPAQQNSYGLSDGAWMKDARGHGKVIYLTNGHYGNSLLEFRDMDTFKSGQASNSYNLPYDFTGTGHVVFNGAFFYNRAFSRDVIRFDLRRRFVSAWTTLHDAILEEQTHRTQTEVEFAVDESGLWLLYPALDTEGFHQEVILLIHLHHRDLQPIQTFRTGLRRGLYGNTFLVCGVLYGVDSMERRYANVTYAFDTHTLTHTVPSLAFTNMHTHTSQVSYNPLDKKLYAWDGGHQMNYDVIFAY
ncbi:olfactomedin-like protein 2B isoform X2 [Girardinichthys multiradiatus]|uniref:olfactomedin-like protein 2B isoform X2 n=1 Tax=Girardinichthys multiradiatus TaxID=208333 RepID=UPI001FACEC98|nr:olfactomedin-like protein 2B isoform X2 [Girardinichthys multiradiatus]